MARIGAALLVAVLAAAPARGQSLVLGGTDTDSAIYSAHKSHVQYASGRYWTAFRSGSCTTSPATARLRVYTSADGSTWSEATGSPAFPGFCPSDPNWAVRFQGTVIVAFAYNSGDTLRYYSKGTLASNGAVTWQQQQLSTGVTGTTDRALSAAIVNGKPVLYGADQGSPGRVSIGSSLDSPTWSGPYVAPALNTSLGAQFGTAGTPFSGGAVFPLFDKDPNDFIIVRASSAAAQAAQSHRVVSIKFDASAAAFTGNVDRQGVLTPTAAWFNASTAGNGETLAEDATTEMFVTANDPGLQSRFAAVQQRDGMIHVVYVNRNNDVVHLRRAAGPVDHQVETPTCVPSCNSLGWLKLADADGSATAVGKVGLTLVDANNLFLFYSLNVEPETAIYWRRYEGRTVWGATTTIPVAGAGDINFSLGTMETATGCNAGVAWNQNTPPGPYDVYFRKVDPSCTAPTVFLRSIGTAADYSTGQVTVTDGSKTVDGVGGTLWLANNRGMGDALVIGDTPYAVASVQSETRLTLTAPFVGTSGTYTYVLRRQFAGGGNAGAALVAWEDCIDGGTACIFFAPASASLVADNRVEIGVMYKDSVFQPPNASNGGLQLRGSRTSGTHRIILTAAPRNRHNGTPAAPGCTTDCASVVYQGNDATQTAHVHNGIEVFDANVTVEWLEFRRFHGGQTAMGYEYAPISIDGRGPADEAHDTVLDHLLIHEYADLDGTIEWSAIRGHDDCCKSATVRNTFVWDGDYRGIGGDEPGDTFWVENSTVDYIHGTGGTVDRRYGVFAEASVMTVRNTIATGDSTNREYYWSSTSPGGFVADGTTGHSSNNISSQSVDARFMAPGANGRNGVLAAALYVAPGSDLHLMSGAADAIDTGLNLASIMSAIDIDGQVRPSGAAWDRGADEFGATTAVRLMSFEAEGADGAVDLAWRTGSELGNQGFHLYRSLSGSGPWTRLTSSLVPGLGSSPVGASYSWRDTGLANGTRYFYRLEDVDASSVSTFHGPVSAVPSAPAGGSEGGAGKPEAGANPVGAPAGECPGWVRTAWGSLVGAGTARAFECGRHGDPEAVSLEVVSQDATSATVELRTGGFYAVREASGGVRVFVRGFDFPTDARAAALPLRRALVDAVVGRGVELGRVVATEEQGFPGLAPAAVGAAQTWVLADGTVRAGRRALAASLARRGPTASVARLLPSVFQGERKSAVVEISPLRFEPASGSLALSRRVVVELLFVGREAGEAGWGSVGRSLPIRRSASGEVLARLHTRGRGVHAMSFEEAFPGRTRGFAAGALRLQRQGRAQAFHLEPATEVFGPGSRLYFHADAAPGSTEFSSETAWELVRSTRGVRMPVVWAGPGSDPIAAPPTGRATFERNRFYLPGLLEAPDPWLWEYLASGAVSQVPFSLSGVEASGTATVEVVLQGGSESGLAVDHHVSVSVNGVYAGEAEFAGTGQYRLAVSVPASLLRGGTNELLARNVGDTGVTSTVYLDRVEVAYPQQALASGGVFEGEWSEGGTVSVGGLGAPAVVLDVTPGRQASWLGGGEATAGGVRFRAEAGHRYVAVSGSAVSSVRVARTPFGPGGGLRSAANQADYVVIAPRAFSAAASRLVERRQGQGLRSRAVSLEEIADEFGHGQASADAIHAFLRHAFHSWTRPSPRYVVLLGAANYDPRNFAGTSRPSPLPALWTKTSYLWTVSDPELGAVNGEDALPDIAVGRLPATTGEEAEALVEKTLAWEDSQQGLGGRAALVADDPDVGGDFEAGIDDVARGFLQGRPVSTIRVRELRGGTRDAIRDALDSGLSLLSYVGHGGASVWASENVWNSWDAASLRAQSVQPVALTLNCLNGYFVSPRVDSLSESLVKGEGRGAIAAISPSSLSLDAPAHAYHRALMGELTSGQHERLGDAFLAAQADYARSGLMPELIGVYQLVGDPALKIR